MGEQNRLASLFSNASLKGTAGALAGNALGPVTIRTEFTPDVTVNPFGKVAEDGSVQPGAQLSIVDRLGLLFKPEVQTNLGTWRPYGAPSGGFVPHLIGAGVIGVAGLALVFGAAKHARNIALVGGAILVAGELRRRFA